MLLEARFTNIGEWKVILQAIGDVTDEAMFICNQDGVTFRGIDPAHVSLLDITFPASSFALYECSATFFGISVTDFRNILSSAANDDYVELAIESSHKMRISIKGRLEIIYDLKLVERTEVSTQIPKVEATSKISLSPSTLAKIMTDIERVSESVTISSIPERVQFLGSGDIGRAQVDLEKGNAELSLLEVVKDSHAVYSLEYLAKIIRNIGKASKNVNMEYGTQTPIRMLFEMPSMAKVDYYLAPRIEN